MVSLIYIIDFGSGTVVSLFHQITQKFKTMKNSIETMLDSFIHDNREYIKENGGNVAEYIMTGTEAQDQGWLWFLDDEEIEEFENDSMRRDELKREITEYVNKNYNYNIEP